MTKQVQLRRGTTAEHSSFTGVVGEVTVDITKDTAVVHDGSTSGGHPLAKESDLTTKVSKSGDTMTGDLSFGDNDKAIFGAGSDLQIYHNGTDSFIDDAGTGNLYIRGNEIQLGKYTGEVGIKFNADGAATLYYNNAAKLATTSDGVDITGEIYANRGRGATYVSGNTSGTFTPDFSEYTNFYIKLTGTTTFANPGDEAVGQSGVFVILQDATGGRTLSVGSQYKTVGGAGITLSTAGSAVDVIPYVVYSADTIVLGQPLLAVS